MIVKIFFYSRVDFLAFVGLCNNLNQVNKRIDEVRIFADDVKVVTIY